MEYQLSAWATVTHQFSSTAEQVFAGWLDVQIMQIAFFGLDTSIVLVSSDLDPVVGGLFSYVAMVKGIKRSHVGEYLQLSKPGKLVFNWQVDQVELPVSKIIIDIEDTPKGAYLVLSHGLPLYWSAFVEQTETAWAQFLVDFDRALMDKNSI